MAYEVDVKMSRITSRDSDDTLYGNQKQYRLDFGNWTLEKASSKEKSDELREFFRLINIGQWSANGARYNPTERSGVGLNAITSPPNWPPSIGAF